jgi:protein-disulfide isomerase
MIRLRRTLPTAFAAPGLGASSTSSCGYSNLLVLALLLVLGAGSATAAFSSDAAQPAPSAFTPLNPQQRAEIAKWWELQPKTDVAIPSDGAKVMVTIFSDYQCPHCRAAHEAYRSVVAKYSADPSVRFVLKHFPLEGECNTFAAKGQHTAACEAAAAVVLARATGKSVQMEEWLFTNQQKLTPSGVRVAAKDVGGIADFNGGYAEALKEVTADARLGGALGVGSTPSLFLNSTKLPAGVVDPAALDALIELELQRAK